MRPIITKDTGRDVTDIIERVAAQHGFDPIGFLGGAIAESELAEHAAPNRRGRTSVTASGSRP